MKENELFTSKAIKLITLIIGLSSIFIMILDNIEMDYYVSQFILPISIILIGFIFLLKKLKLEYNKKAYYFLIPICLILLSYFIIKVDDSNLSLNILITPILLSIFFLSLTSKNYQISNFIKYFFYLLFHKIEDNLKYVTLPFKESKNEKNKNIYNIFIGCIIGIPIATILLMLLSSADMYFSVFVNKIFGSILNSLNIENSIFNIVSFLITFVCLFSVFINILHCKSEEKILKENKRKEINISISSTILIIINFVFVLFLISEISKITVNFLQLPIEYTYAEYAREGFFQLLGVTLINISIIFYYIYKTNALEKNINIRKLLLLLAIFSILLIFNSYYRMFLYINAYKFTVLRLQVILFLTMELILFLLTIKKLVYKVKYNESFVYMMIVLTTYTLNLYLCSEPIIKIINNLI